MKNLKQLVESCGNEIAVLDVIHNVSLSYSEFYYKVEQLAFQLKSAIDFNDNPVIGYYGEKGYNSIVAFWAIYSCGGTYLPLNEEDPVERTTFILADAACRLIVTDDLSKVNFNTENRQIVSIDPNAQSFDFSDTNTNHSTEAPSYIIYTSGTTGKPKGSLISRKSFINLYEQIVKKFDVTSSDRILQFTSLSFDASIWEMGMATMSGGAAVFLPKDVLLNPILLKEAIRTNNITILTAVPSFISSMSTSTFLDLRTLILAGEHPSINTVTPLIDKINLYNAYGPSECTVLSTIYRFEKENLAIKIGKAIEGVSLLICDEKNEPVSGKGEICIGGLNVCMGYLNRDDLNETKFFVKDGVKFYKSGDIGFIDEAGDLIYIGRSDSQFKYNGHRIEPSEINKVILAKSNTITNVFTDLLYVNGRKLITSFIETRADFSEVNISSYLESVLPYYMIPRKYFFVSKFPTTINGKLNKKALFKIFEQELAHDTPQTEYDNFSLIIANSWKEVLGIDVTIRDDDHFFNDLGADSLSAVLLYSIIRKNLGIDYKAKLIYEKPVFHEFVKSLKANNEQNEENLLANFRLDTNTNVFQKGKPYVEKQVQEKDYFITGGTGLVGLQLIIKLLKTEPDTKLLCLLRNKDGVDGKQRLIDKLKKYHPYFDENRLVIVNSDFSNLDEQVIETCFSDYDVASAFLCAADMRHFVDYNSSRDMNVINQLKLVNLCHKFNVKLTICSTVAIFNFFGGSFSETTDLTTIQPRVSYGYGSSKLAFELIIDTYFDKNYPITICRIGAISPRDLDVSGSDQWLAVYYFLSHKMNCLCKEMDVALLPYCDLDWLVDGIVSLSEVSSKYEVFHMHYPKAISVNAIVDNENSIRNKVDKDVWAQKAIAFCTENKSVGLSSVYSTINIVNEVISYLPLPDYTNALTTDKLNACGELSPV